MCLAIPARVISIKDNLATVDMAGVRRQADIRLLKGLKVGEYVLIHAGFAIEKIAEKEAKETLKIFREMV